MEANVSENINKKQSVPEEITTGKYHHPKDIKENEKKLLQDIEEKGKKLFQDIKENEKKLLQDNTGDILENSTSSKSGVPVVIVTLNGKGCIGLTFASCSSCNYGLTIGAIAEGSPAKGKLHVGDTIIAVNGISIINMHVDNSVKLIKDSKHRVTLTIMVKSHVNSTSTQNRLQSKQREEKNDALLGLIALIVISLILFCFSVFFFKLGINSTSTQNRLLFKQSEEKNDALLGRIAAIVISLTVGCLSMCFVTLGINCTSTQNRLQFKKREKKNDAFYGIIALTVISLILFCFSVCFFKLGRSVVEETDVVKNETGVLMENFQKEYSGLNFKLTALQEKMDMIGRALVKNFENISFNESNSEVSNQTDQLTKSTPEMITKEGINLLFWHVSKIKNLISDDSYSFNFRTAIFMHVILGVSFLYSKKVVSITEIAIAVVCLLQVFVATVCCKSYFDANMNQ